MEENKPPTVKIKFDDPNILHDFYIIISPEDGYWQGGRFKFHVKVKFVVLLILFNLNFVDSSRVQHGPPRCGVFDEALASKYICGWFHLLVPVEATQCRWARLGPH